MSTHHLAFSLDVGVAGLTLKAAISTGGTIHATVRDAAVTALGQGFYEWLPATIPNGYQGTAVFYTGTIGAGTDLSAVTVYAISSINPTESGTSDPTNPVITTPDAGMCRIYGTLLKPDGLAAANEKVTATLHVPRSGPTGASTAVVAGRTATATTAADGTFTLDVIRTDELVSGCTYEIACESAALLKKRAKLEVDTLDIATLV